MDCTIPDVIMEKDEELTRLVEQYPIDIPVKEAAHFLGMDVNSLRGAIQAGVPFALFWRQSSSSNRAFHIPTYLFYRWCKCGGIR